MTRRMIVFKKDGKFYASQEFNGDKNECAQVNSAAKILVAWPEIMKLFTGKASVSSFQKAVKEAERLYGYESVDVEELDELPSCEEIWLTTGGFLYKYTKYGEPTMSLVADLAREYGFSAHRLGNTVALYAKNTDGQWTTWFSITVREDGEGLIRGSNTDQSNIWLHQTRPDMTPERCVEFFQHLNDTLGLFGEGAIKLCSWIDPEDWQEIAGVNDAHEDPRYTGTVQG